MKFIPFEANAKTVSFLKQFPFLNNLNIKDFWIETPQS